MAAQRQRRPAWSGQVDPPTLKSSLEVSVQAADADSASELESALDEVKITLEYDPGNERAVVMREEIQAELMAEQAERTRNAENGLLISQHSELGVKHYTDNEYILARADWRNVLAIDPENEQALDYQRRTEDKLDERLQSQLSAAAADERAGRLPEAIGKWNIVLMIDPENAEAPDAIERLKRSIDSMSRDYQEANRQLKTIDLYNRAVTALAEGRYEEAITLARQVLQLDPDHAEAKELITMAERRMQPLSDEQNEEIRTLWIEGHKYFEQKDYVNAMDVWSKILLINPDNESVRKNIEEAKQRLKKLETPEGG